MDRIRPYGYIDRHALQHVTYIALLACRKVAFGELWTGVPLHCVSLKLLKKYNSAPALMKSEVENRLFMTSNFATIQLRRSMQYATTPVCSVELIDELRSIS